MIRPLILLAAMLGGAPPAHAEVVDKSAAGFEVRQEVVIAAPAAKVWTSLLASGQWWNGSHSWSGSAANLAIDLERGCFCETLPKGFVRHMEVVYQDGGSELRLAGGLGPLQFTGASGHLVVKLKEMAGATTVTLTYDVGGYARGGLAEG